MAQDRDQNIYTHRVLSHGRRTPPTAPQTLEETDKDSIRAEASELDHVRVTNKHAMDMASKCTYGHLCSEHRKDSVEIWIECMPYDWKLDNAGTARPASIVIYTDWLNWQRCNARSWLYKLDR
jgi:hypothetical protein